MGMDNDIYEALNQRKYNMNLQPAQVTRDH